MTRSRSRLILTTVLVLFATTSVWAAPSPLSTPFSVGRADRAQVVALIRALYHAYSARDLKTVMRLEHPAIEASAMDWQHRGKGRADDVRQAFRGATAEFFSHKDFKMKPLDIAYVQVRREGPRIVVTSVLPVIASEPIEVNDNGHPLKVSLKINKFVFQRSPSGKNFEIIQMVMGDGMN